MSDQRTESQEQGSATLNKEQIELIGVVLDLRLKAVVSEMRLAIKEEVEKVRAEVKTDMRWFIGIMVGVWLAAAGLAVNKWPQAVPVAAVAPAAPVGQVAPVAQVAPVGQVAPVAPDLNEPADLSQP